MLGKLLKYDLRDIYKVLVIFYIIATLFAIITRILFNIDNSVIFSILGNISSGVLISMFFSIVINNLMRAWVRFTKNLYGDESYLTHTLPVSKKSIYLAKFLAVIMTMLSSILVILLCMFIAYYSKENMKILKNILEGMALMYDSTVIKMLLVVFFVFFLEMVFAALCGYTGIILGYKSNNGRIGKSVLFGIIYYMLFQCFTLFIVFIIGLFNNDVMKLFTSSEILNIDVVKYIMGAGIVIYLFYIIINYFTSIKLFEKGVNVE